MKDSKRNIINLIFSAFLIIGYIVCTYFFSGLAKQVAGTYGLLIQIAILLVFGLLLFYATRVGDGKQVKRFSLPVLLLLDLPCIYIIVAAMVDVMPLHEQLAPVDANLPLILILATVALGYGIPYTFLSGYEIKEDDEEEAQEEIAEEVEETVDEKPETEEEAAPIEGGIAEELAEAEAEEAEEIKEVSDEAEDIKIETPSVEEDED